MDEILTRCGYRCDLCLAYRPNVEANPSNRVVLSDGWHAYFGFRIPPEDILCDGCMADNPKLIDRSCPVRPCVIERQLSNCADCPEYGCTRLADESWSTICSPPECPPRFRRKTAGASSNPTRADAGWTRFGGRTHDDFRS